MPLTPNSRSLLIVLGDQLSTSLKIFDSFNKTSDSVWMAEVASESEYVWSSKQRITLFLSAMRHFARELAETGATVIYQSLEDQRPAKSLSEALSRTLKTGQFTDVKLTHPGEYRVLKDIKTTCSDHGIELEVVEDNSFLSTPDDFEKHAASRKQLRMEFFYREMRRKHNILMDGNKPEGGKWNYDASNRKPFGKSGPQSVRERLNQNHDTITLEVISLVNERFAKHPGSLDTFHWPTQRRDALRALEDFTEHDLKHFGTHQDAMWSGEPFLHHALLASSLNIKLLSPKEVIHAAEDSYKKGRAPIEAVEGFIRQILGWREYVRGIYWMRMPDYEHLNKLSAQQPLPSFYWTGETDLNCIHETVTQTLKYGYAHHIQRLMVLGLYSLLLGVNPREVHRWFLAVYVDAVEWVELPNSIGMSQYADGGIMASKPYVATGKYVNRMSNYCKACRFDPDKRTGEDACPFTNMYWDFLDRHKESLTKNPRMKLQIRNLENIDSSELAQIRATAKRIRTAHAKA